MSTRDDFTDERGIIGTYHRLSEKHCFRYVTEFEGRRNNRRLDTIEKMSTMAANAEGKSLRYEDLIGPKHTRQPRMHSVFGAENFRNEIV